MNQQQQPAPQDDSERRNFLVKFAAAAVGGIVALVPAIFGGGFVLTPLLTKKATDEADGSDGFLRVGSVSSLTPGGPPQQFKIVGTKQDAWTTYAETALGAVFVKLDEEGKPSAFNASCPHLGCTVNYKSDQQSYICPCHDSSFSVTGERNNEIPPRNLDALDVEIRNDNEIWVRFQNFRAGTSQKIPV